MQESETLKRIVKERARQLKSEGRGYLKSIHVIACEIYDSAQGKDTPIGGYAATTGVPLGDLLKTFTKLIPILGMVIEWALRQKANANELKMQDEKARKEAIAEISQMITPWIDEAWCA
jgi:hypothetical protein